jgi:uncharacterized protein (AIM24 family)
MEAAAPPPPPPGPAVVDAIPAPPTAAPLGEEFGAGIEADMPVVDALDQGVPPAPVAVDPAAAVPAPPAPSGPVDTAPPAPVDTAPPAPVDNAPPAPGPGTRSANYGASIGGISTELLTDERYAEVQSNERVIRQNSRLLKVTLGEDILAKQGSMVAFQGQIDFNYEGSGAAKFLKKAVTGEGLPLMRCSGQGELFLADSAFQVHVIHLAGAGLTVSGKNVLAFEPSLSWDIERLKGGAMMAGGLFNTRLEGHGWVAITTDGDPVVLRTDQPTFADTDAAVAWSSSLTTTVNSTVKAGALIGRGSGEAVQLVFQGEGIVIVQPSEGSTVPPHSH